MPKVFRSQLIETIYPQGAQITKLQFQDQPYLRGKQILAIEVLNNDDMSASPTNNAPITNAQALTTFLTLYLTDSTNPNNVGEWIQNVPFTLMHRIQNTAADPFVRQMFDMTGQVVYWEKCYWSFSAPLTAAAPISLLINVYFK